MCLKAKSWKAEMIMDTGVQKLKIKTEICIKANRNCGDIGETHRKAI